MEMAFISCARKRNKVKCVESHILEVIISIWQSRDYPVSDQEMAKYTLIGNMASMVHNKIMMQLEYVKSCRDEIIRHHKTMCDEEHFNFGSMNECTRSKIIVEDIRNPSIRRIVNNFSFEHLTLTKKYVDGVDKLVKFHDELCNCNGEQLQ